MNDRFAGCHGIEVSPASLGLELGWLAAPPPLHVDVEMAEAVERSPDAELVWELEEPPGFGLPAITTQTWHESPERVWVGNTLNMALRIDHRANLVTVAAKNGNQQVVLEALASIALPMVAQRNGSLVLHASAAANGDSGILVCAESGSGKSSLLMGLAAAGWQAVSEDQCAIDLDPEGRHRVWPGPSWVRLKHGAPSPALVAGRSPRFEALDKSGWDLSDHVAHGPAVLARIVLLEPAGGDDVVWEPVPETDVIAALAKQATWMQRQEDYPSHVLPAVAKLAMSVPAFRLRLPRQPDWLENAVAVIQRP